MKTIVFNRNVKKRRTFLSRVLSLDDYGMAWRLSSELSPGCVEPHVNQRNEGDVHTKVMSMFKVAPIS